MSDIYSTGAFDDPKHVVDGPGLVRTMHTAVSYKGYCAEDLSLSVGDNVCCCCVIARYTLLATAIKYINRNCN